MHSCCHLQFIILIVPATPVMESDSQIISHFTCMEIWTNGIKCNSLVCYSVHQRFSSETIWNWPNSQIPECTCSISQNAPFRTEMCTFLFWMEHCGIWNRCILEFVKLVYSLVSMRIMYGLVCRPFLLTQIYVIIWHHQATMSWYWNYLASQRKDFSKTPHK